MHRILYFFSYKLFFFFFYFIFFFFFSFNKLPYGIGCLTTTTFLLFFLKISTILLEVWDFPAPVLTAQTLIIGTLDLIIVSLGPNKIKLASLAKTIEALCITSI